jgi:hypothetical protein
MLKAAAESAQSRGEGGDLATEIDFRASTNAAGRVLGAEAIARLCAGRREPEEARTALEAMDARETGNQPLAEQTSSA